jgi:hypothetical protein
MKTYPEGRPFHGEFSSANASGLSEVNSRFALYAANSLSTITLAANEQVVITDIFVLAGAALTVTLYDGADNVVAGGEQVLKGNFAANGGVAEVLGTPHYCQVATYPKVLTSGAGQIDCTIRGVIVRQGQ